MIFTFDAMSLGQVIAHATRTVLREHGLELTDDDQNVAGEAAADWLLAAQNHVRERAEMVDSVSRDLDELPVLGGEAPIPRGVELRRLGIEPPV